MGQASCVPFIGDHLCNSPCYNSASVLSERKRRSGIKIFSSFAVSVTRKIALIRFCTWVGVYQVVIFSYMFSHLCVFLRPSVYCAAIGTGGMMIVLALFSLGLGNNR